MTIYDLEATSPFKTQADFGRWATFNFNEDVTRATLSSLVNEVQMELFFMVIKNKHLLVNERQSIDKFFDRLNSVAEMERGVEVLKVCTKSGIHLLHAKTLLSADTQFVSVNEPDYVIRSHTLPMAIYNPLFAFMNEDLITKAIACKEYLVKVIAGKSDVVNVTDVSVTMTNGDVFKLIVIK